MNETVVVIQTTVFTSNYNYRGIVHVLTPFSTKYRSYLLKLIHICGHFPTVNNRRYGHCYVKKFTLCTFTEFHTRVKANSARSFQNVFLQVIKGFNYDIFLKMAFFLSNVIF